MKTKEFIEKVKKLGYSTQKADVDVNGRRIVVISIGLNGGYVGTVYPDEMYRFELKNISSNIINDIGWDLMALILEYTASNLNDREEEKKYYLLFPDEFSIHPGNNNQWLLGKDSQGRYDEVSISTKHVQNMFTQKEIDAMPFDTNFFIKEDVK